MKKPVGKYPIAMQAIKELGGEELNRNYILYRTMHDVLSKIRSATQEELDYRDESNNSLLHFAAATSDGLPIVKLLLSKGLDPTVENSNGFKASSFAKNAAILALLLTNASQRQIVYENRRRSTIIKGPGLACHGSDS
jgi:hypothetical protein